MRAADFRLPSVRRLLGVAVLLFSGACLLWGVWPLGSRSRNEVASGALRLALTWPAAQRAGDAGRVRLAVSETAAAGLPASPGEPAAGNLLAEARFETLGVRVEPGDVVAQPLPPEREVEFFWKIRAQQGGEYAGTLWLYLRRVPPSGESGQRQPILAQPVRLRALELFGLDGPTARYLGGLGMLIGAVLILARPMA